MSKPKPLNDALVCTSTPLTPDDVKQYIALSRARSIDKRPETILVHPYLRDWIESICPIATRPAKAQKASR